MFGSETQVETTHIKRLGGGEVPPQGSAVNFGEDDSASDRGDLGVPSSGGCNEGKKNQVYQDVYIQLEEHGGALHIYSNHSGPMPGYGY